MKFFLAVFLFAANSAVFAALRMPALFSDHMVLQAKQESAVWGWASPGAKIAIEFIDRTGKILGHTEATAAPDGFWKSRLSALETGTAGRLQIQSDKDGTKTIEDVILGEVWLASGQSNMAYRANGTNGSGHYHLPKESEVDGNFETARQEAAAAQPEIRYFRVESKGADSPQDDVQGKWIVATEDTVGECSAVAWYFAVEIHKKAHAPVGMITSSVGGTVVEAWMPREAIDATSLAQTIWTRHKNAIAKYREQKKEGAAPTDPQKSPRTERAYAANDKNAPARLYNGMVHGLEPYTIQGILWYQGEANAPTPSEYGELIQALVKGWRKQWNEELPFYYVELANLGARQSKPSEGGWALIREAQASVLDLPKTGVATAVDLGVANNIHPPFKEPVGKRLAGLALADIYGQSGLVRSPQFASFAVDGEKVRLKFQNAEGLKPLKGKEIGGFAIRGESGDWQWAEARLDGEDVLVWNSKISKPAAVRYGWAGNPILSLENKAGLPLRPFRTDRE